MRRAAMNYVPPSRPELEDKSVALVKRKVLSIWYSVFDLVRRPAYFIPLLMNLSGSVWFFLMVGQAGKLVFLAPRSLECMNRIGNNTSNKILRVKSHSANYQFFGFSLHRSGRMVGGRESDIKRYNE
jgi:hypothetical protein